MDKRTVLLLTLLLQVVSSKDHLNIKLNRPGPIDVCSSFDFNCISTRLEDARIDHDSLMLYIMMKRSSPAKEKVLFYTFLNDDLSFRKKIGINPGISDEYSVERIRTSQERHQPVKTVVKKNIFREDDVNTTYHFEYRFRVDNITVVQKSPNYTTKKSGSSNGNCPPPTGQTSGPSYTVPDKCEKGGIPDITSYVSWHHGAISPNDTSTVVCPEPNCKNPFKVAQLCCPFCPMNTNLCELETRGTPPKETCVKTDVIQIDMNEDYTYDYGNSTDRDIRFDECKTACVLHNVCKTLVGCLDGEGEIRCFMADSICKYRCTDTNETPFVKYCKDGTGMTKIPDDSTTVGGPVGSTDKENGSTTDKENGSSTDRENGSTTDKENGSSTDDDQTRSTLGGNRTRANPGLIIFALLLVAIAILG